MGPWEVLQLRVRVDQWKMTTLRRASELEPHHRMQFGLTIFDTNNSYTNILIQETIPS